MIEIIRITSSYALIGCVVWILLCFLMPVIGYGDWMAANSYEMSCTLMLIGALVGLFAALADRRHSRTRD